MVIILYLVKILKTETETETEVFYIHSLLRFFSKILNFFHQHPFKFAAMVGYYYTLVRNIISTFTKVAIHPKYSQLYNFHSSKSIWVYRFARVLTVDRTHGTVFDNVTNCMFLIDL